MSSSKGQVTSTTSSSKSAPSSLDNPTSYAQYIVQKNSNVAAIRQREPPPPNSSRTNNAGVICEKRIEPVSVSSTSSKCETEQNCIDGTESGFNGPETKETRLDGTEQKDANLSLGPKPLGSGSSIIVSPRQVNIVCI